MRTNDQWFNAGDKVMRVGGNVADAGIYSGEDKPSSPVYGVVYCVEDFYEGPQHNIVMLVGFGGWRRQRGYPHPIGWPASSFRKVEEIKLCVAAAQHAKTQQPVP